MKIEEFFISYLLFAGEQFFLSNSVSGIIATWTIKAILYCWYFYKRIKFILWKIARILNRQQNNRLPDVHRRVLCHSILSYLAVARWQLFFNIRYFCSIFMCTFYLFIGIVFIVVMSICSIIVLLYIQAIQQ